MIYLPLILVLLAVTVAVVIWAVWPAASQPPAHAFCAIRRVASMKFSA